jgi:DNA-binding FadR family transcriptional regulator
MANNNRTQLSTFMQYLASIPAETAIRLPPLSELSGQLGLSVASLREQMEVARMMGLIEVHPRTGIQKRAYSFTDTVMVSLMYAIASGEDAFQAFSDFRKHVEAAYWKEAASQMSEEDLAGLTRLVTKATAKLHSQPPQNPLEEHKEFHMCMYRKIQNPYVQGVLEAYWIMYEVTGMAIYTDMPYLEQVWKYHQGMVEALQSGEIDRGYRLFMEHVDLITKRVVKDKRHRFE